MAKPDFGAFTERLFNLLYERNQRYGTHNIQGQPHVLERVKDKMARLERAVADGEGAAVDWEDLAGYSAIGWLLERGLWDDRGTLRRVYYAHPSGGDLGPWIPTLDRIHAAIAKVYAVYRPVGAFHSVSGHADWLWEVNLQAIRFSDMLIAVLPYSSNGVAAELLYAKERNKTVWALALEEMAQSSLVQYAATRLFTSVPTLISALEGVKSDGNG